MSVPEVRENPDAWYWKISTHAILLCQVLSLMAYYIVESIYGPNKFLFIAVGVVQLAAVILAFLRHGILMIMAAFCLFFLLVIVPLLLL